MNSPLIQMNDDWFDTAYYHILYKDRNDSEAQHFIDGLTKITSLPSNSSILDLACGRGRHSKYLSDIGYDVLGIDTSSNSISHAGAFQNSRLRFLCHDMRVPLGMQFDMVTNLFTSFGYTLSEEDDVAVLRAIKQSLKPQTGIAIIDYFNAEVLEKGIIPKEIKTVDGIDFHLKRYIKENYVFKEIRFENKGSNYFYRERVKLLHLADFKKMLNQLSLKIISVFGDYKFNKFDLMSSPRLIMTIE